MSDDLPAPFDALARAMAGDPDAPDEVFTDDIAFHDRTSGDELDGIDEVREVWAEYAGRRAVVEFDEILVGEGSDAEERAAVRFTVWFRADAHQYAQRGTAWVGLDGGRISEWDAVWVESEEDLTAWSGD